MAGRHARQRRGLARRISRAHHRRARRERYRRSHRHHRPLRLRPPMRSSPRISPPRINSCARSIARSCCTTPPPTRRWRRVRLRRRDRHRHRQDARARPSARAAHHLQIRGAARADGPEHGPARAYPGMRIGLFGAALIRPMKPRACGAHALKRLGLDQVWWLVSPQIRSRPNPARSPRLKSARAMAEAAR